MTRVITENLRRSGQFALINPAYFEKFIRGTDVLPSFADWRAINVPALVTGRISRESDGRLKTEFRLWKVFGGTLLRDQRYFTTPDNFRRIAHVISDAIYQPLTGERGYFDSRVVFVEETGPNERRVERLALMDQDGANLRYLTAGEGSIATPHFSPSTREIIYTSFGQGDPRVYLLNIETGQREAVGDFPGMTFSPRFSPDGRRVVMSLRQDGKSNLFAMDLRSKVMTRLTDTPGTAPSYSPFGNQICFEADNGGKPEIHAMAVGRRIASAWAGAFIRRPCGPRAAIPSPSPRWAPAPTPPLALFVSTARANAFSPKAITTIWARPSHPMARS
jgi:TolB protein